MASVDFRKLDELVLSENLSEILAHAENGDVVSARYALMSIAHCLSTNNTHPTTGDPLPVPSFVRDYVSRAIYRMVGPTPKGSKKPMTAEMAFNLTPRNGRPTVPYFRMRLAGYLVIQGIKEHGLSANKAACEAVEMINRQVEEKSLVGVWRMFDGSIYEPATFLRWYKKVQPEVEGFYNQAIEQKP